MANPSNSISFEHFESDDPEIRCCDWPGCMGEGLHRAPKSRDEIKSYHWFCVLHAREYNVGWNYYAGMSDDEVEADVRQDTVWHRPSWPLGAGKISAEDMMGQMGAFGPEWDEKGGFGKRPDRNAKPGRRQAWAVAVFGLTGPVKTDAVKARYKELVKQHHPDTNGGDKAAEEKIKEINEAHQIIMDMLDS
jgi:hypothetical protein